MEDQVARKGYGNISEYFRTLLREAQAREADAKLEALLLEGLGSGDAVPADNRFWKELRAEAARLIAELSAPINLCTPVSKPSSLSLNRFTNSGWRWEK